MIGTSIKSEGKTLKVGSNIIVINGKHYDAKSGRLLETVASAKSTATPPQRRQNGPSLDGFSKRPSAAKHIVTAHAVHNKAEKSKTLMRGAVKKPVSKKVHAAAHTIGKSPAKHAKPAAAHTPQDHARAARAVGVPKSSLVSRFGHGTSSHAAAKPHTTHVAHLPVKPAPAISIHHAAPLPVSRSLPNPFATAVENANSHLQASPAKSSRKNRLASKLRISARTASAGSFVLAGLLLGGFFVYQNIPNLAMKVAATRSGVEASMPGYKPAGFALSGPIKYSTGKISISYRSNTDERAYQVTQSASKWSSESLLENFVAVERKPYQTYQDKGKTIYIYDDSNATWVDKGVWYQVEGKSSLNSDQLLRIANSL